MELKSTSTVLFQTFITCSQKKERIGHYKNYAIQGADKKMSPDENTNFQNYSILQYKIFYSCL